MCTGWCNSAADDQSCKHSTSWVKVDLLDVKPCWLADSISLELRKLIIWSFIIDSIILQGMQVKEIGL